MHARHPSTPSSSSSLVLPYVSSHGTSSHRSTTEIFLHQQRSSLVKSLQRFFGRSIGRVVVAFLSLLFCLVLLVSSYSGNSKGSNVLKVAFLVDSIGEKNDHLLGWLEAMRNNFCTQHRSDIEPVVFLWTDRQWTKQQLGEGVVVIPGGEKLQEAASSLPVSLLRHQVFLNYGNHIRSMDFVVKMDVDLHFEQEVCAELINNRLTGVFHPLFWKLPQEDWPLETISKSSSAFISSEEAQIMRGYVSSSLIAASPKEMLNIHIMILQHFRDDQSSGITVDSDEPYWNRYVFDYSAFILPPFYNYPEPPSDMWLLETYPQFWLDENEQRKEKIKIIHKYTEEFKNPRDKRSKMHIYESMTVGIKTLERPDCLKRLLYTLYSQYPSVKVIVVDDSKEINNAWYVTHNPHLTYIKTPFDIGLSRGRNILMNLTTTDYHMLMDDDFVIFEKEFKMEYFLDVLETTDMDIVGGSVEGDSSSWRIEVSNETLHVKPHIPRDMTPEAEEELKGAQLRRRPLNVPIPGCYETEMVTNFFACKTKPVRELQWDDYLAVGEHEEFFLRAKEKKLRVALCRDQGFGITNDNSCGYKKKSKSYQAMRGRIFHFWAYALEKHGLTRLSTPAGQTWLACKGDELRARDCPVDTTMPNPFAFGTDLFPKEEDVLVSSGTPLQKPSDVGPNSVLYFNGKDTCIEGRSKAMDGLFSRQQPYTIEYWFVPKPRAGTLAARFDLGNKGQFILGYDGWTQGFFFRECPPWEKVFVTVPQQKWVHFAVAFNGTYSTIFINSKEVITKEFDVVWADAEEVPFTVGCLFQQGKHSDFFDGLISHLKVWSKALTKKDISRSMNQVLRGSERDLVLYWPLDEVTNNGTIIDMTGNVHGTLFGHYAPRNVPPPFLEPKKKKL